MPQSRQLAAIMFTDIVGYTSMMGKNEKNAFEILNQNRGVQKPIIDQFNGRWIKELGDGVMASFLTASDAVNAAIKIQQACNAANIFQLRIGIHLGEVVFENEDVFGDGVNITSRIQSLAPPGGIWISESVQNNVANKNNINTEFVKIEHLKNVKEPVRIYQIKAEGVESPKPAQSSKNETSIPQPKSKTRKIITLVSISLFGLALIGYFLIPDWNNDQFEKSPSEKSIAVMPFADMSPEKDQEYFSDGISEEIINALAKISGLKVAGRTSSFSYKGVNKNLKSIGDELGVETILEGSVRKSGNQLRITAQLINTSDGFHVWTETFDVELTDIFGVQDEITRSIVTALHVVLLSNEELTHAPITNPEAYTTYLRARQQLSLRGVNLIEAKKLFEEATRLDPSFGPSYSGLARTLSVFPNFREAVRDYQDQFSISEFMKMAKESAEMAVQYDPKNAEAYSALGSIAAFYEWNWEAAERAFRKSIQLSPNDAEMYNFIGDYFMIVLDKKLAIEMESKAVELDPLHAINYANLCMTYRTFNEYENAIRISDVGKSMGFWEFGGPPMGWTYLAMNNIDMAKLVLNELPEQSGHYLELKAMITIAEGDRVGAYSIIDKMDRRIPARVAELYLALEDWENAAVWIEKAYNDRDPILVYFSLIKLPEDYPDHPALRKAFDKPELNKLFEIRRRNLKKSSTGSD